MGRIKQLMVKRASKELMNREQSFAEEFNSNKKILGSTMPSKKVRNKIAGYIARLKKAERIIRENPQARIRKTEDVSEETSYS
ncbi:30S ribosomal protein S17e [Candidatus Pacearchaeota archaeon]|nr:30S ribosomal protein S17e [Candidatus Pacearchaeota archaeon]